MPPAPVGEGDFADDPASDVQIARRAGCDTVLLAFCGQGHEIGPPMPMMHRWLGGLGASVVYLRDFNGCKYLGGIKSLAADRPASLEALRRIVDQLGGRRILCYGNSAGGFGALDYGLALGADAILCMAGATNLDPDANRFTRSATTARRLRSAFLPGGVRTNIFTSHHLRPQGMTTGYAEQDARREAMFKAMQNAPSNPEDPLAAITMDIIEVGERVLRGIRRNDLFIITHPEFREGIQARNDALIRAIPDEPLNQTRLEFLRRAGTLLDQPIYAGQTTPKGRPTPSGE